jgi:hypothetical protein
MPRIFEPRRREDRKAGTLEKFNVQNLNPKFKSKNNANEPMIEMFALQRS